MPERFLIIAGLAVVSGLVRAGRLVLVRSREGRAGVGPWQAVTTDPDPMREGSTTTNPADVASSDPPITVSR